MRPLLALLAFMTCIVIFYFQPTPNPSVQIDCLKKEVKAKEVLFDHAVEYVEIPTELSMP